MGERAVVTSLDRGLCRVFLAFGPFQLPFDAAARENRPSKVCKPKRPMVAVSGRGGGRGLYGARYAEYRVPRESPVREIQITV
jgi:hypothetical protein